MSNKSPLSPTILKLLSDKLYEKRKNAALDIQSLAKQLAVANDTDAIRSILKVLQDDFAFSGNPNCRKGGLIGLAAIGIALGQHFDSILNYLPELAPPVLSCFGDADSRVRYYACEALYNISKVARTDILTFFNRIFVGLYKLASDPDPSVKNGAEMLDRLIKDIVNEESTALDLETFIPMLQERIYTVDPNSRQFVLSWMTVLESMSDLNMIAYLPTYLEGLFRILSDTALEIRRMCEAILGELLGKLKDNKSADFSATVEIVLKFCISEDPLTKLMAIKWLHTFTCITKEPLLPYMSKITGAVLPALSHSVDGKLRDLAIATNNNLKQLIRELDENELDRAIKNAEEAAASERSVDALEDGQSGNGKAKTEPGDGEHTQDKQTILAVVEDSIKFNFSSMMMILTMQLLNESVATRMSSLEWFFLLHEKLPRKIFDNVDEFLLVLLKTLSDPSDKVVSYDLRVLATLSTCPSDEANAELQELADNFFKRIMIDILKLFSTDNELFQQRGSFIIRQLSIFVDTKKVFKELAGILLKEEDYEFANLMVQMLNLILLTAPELFDLRQELKKLETEESRELFCLLFKSWCHSPVSTYSLCLLSQLYDNCCELLLKFSNLEMTVALLVEIDKLIQLLESPVFTYLRLQLLDPQRYAYLVKALYGLLMLLPQSEAYNTLKSRLDCIPTIVSSLELLLKEDAAKGKTVFKGNIQSKLNFDELLQYFDHVQNMHVAATMEGRSTLSIHSIPMNVSL